MTRSETLRQAQVLVVKVGSSLVTHQALLESWVEDISALKQAGKQVILVSSGAVAEGMQRLSMSVRPRALNDLQAVAAVGQMGLMQRYEQAFRAYGVPAAQVLLTHDDLSDRKRYLNARSTLRTLLAWGVLPIINENDTVVTDEFRFGDNDTLGALAANLLEADVFIILTDQEGLYSADPRQNPNAQLINEALAGDPQLESMAGGAGSHIGTGGMFTKVLAAKRASRSGSHTVIASGRAPQVLLRLSQGEALGTYLKASAPKRTARKQWLANQLQVRGQLILNQGAVTQLLKEGRSLLPIGVVAVRGIFQRGDAVACCDESGVEFARGLSNYAADEVSKIQGLSSTLIAEKLGYVDAPEVIHRDNLVLLEVLNGS